MIESTEKSIFNAFILKLAWVTPGSALGARVQGELVDVRRGLFSAALLGVSLLFVPAMAATSAQAADPTAPRAELAPGEGELVPGGKSLSIDALFHNSLDTDITDSFIVAVGARLAPPAAKLTPDQIRIEWFDAASARWRSVELTAGETALSGYLSTDEGLPSVGSLPAGQTARIGLRVSIAAEVSPATTLQFVTQGLLQPVPDAEPVPLMDAKASYSVVAEASGTPTPTSTPTQSPSASASRTSKPTGGASASVSLSPSASGSSGAEASALPADGGGDQLADSGVPRLAVIVGTAAFVLVCVGGFAFTVTRRLRRN
ncbi:hypothetical protein IOD14_19635 [Streptomyces sp. A2-16]|uniref:hypothetical protein n=1 Tax=Streptomyces sp. A2-16 TaxID=2781734 RepID=UPI001BAECD22|nr:hypothetical protein [Streptomyces sp. A2-16]QUC58831.1 hypothetical protein IOD14_19635 [Streptomyces sp. A2-16]